MKVNMCTLFGKCDGIWTIVNFNLLYVCSVSLGDRGECAGVQRV